MLCDEKGKKRVGIAVAADGPGLALCDEKGTVRAALGAVEERSSESSLVLCDKEGKVLWEAP